MSTVDDLADNWLIYSEREETIQKELQALKKSKKEIGEKLLAHMKQNAMDDYTTERGTILFKTKVVKPSSCNKKTMKEGLDDINWSNIKDSEQLTEHIFRKLQSKTNESLSRKKTRKKKTKK